MENLKQAFIDRYKSDLAEFKDNLAPINEWDDLNHWRYNDILTPYMRKKTPKQWNGIQEKKDYLSKRAQIVFNQRLNEKLTRLETLQKEERQIENFVISVVWKRSRIWGANPTATLKVRYTNGTRETFTSDSISGCGYCKLSTAIAQVLNQCDSIIKKMTLIKDKNPLVKNHDLLGYGSGYGIIPQFEGGVGESSLRKILENIGYELLELSSTDSSDFYFYQVKKSA